MSLMAAHRHMMQCEKTEAKLHVPGKKSKSSTADDPCRSNRNKETMFLKCSVDVVLVYKYDRKYKIRFLFHSTVVWSRCLAFVLVQAKQRLDFSFMFVFYEPSVSLLRLPENEVQRVFGECDMIADKEGWQGLLECRRSQVQWREDRSVEHPGPASTQWGNITQWMWYCGQDFFYNITCEKTNCSPLLTDY